MVINNGNIKTFSSNLTNIKDSLNTLWSGETSLTLSDSLSDSILGLEGVFSSLEVFNTALGKLEKYKENETEIANYERLILYEEQHPSLPYTEKYIEDGVEKTRVKYTINVNLIRELDALRNEYVTANSILKSEIVALLASIGAKSDEDITFIADFDDAEIIKQYDYGCIYEFKTDDGLRYQIYVPNRYTSNTSLVVYDAGDSGDGGNSYKNWQTWEDKFERENVDAIVIRSVRKDTSACYIDAINKLNLNPQPPKMFSHSGGTAKSSIKEYEDLMDEGYGKNGLLGILDGYTPASWWKSQGIIDKLNENNTVVVGIAQGDDAAGYGQAQKDLAKLHPNVLILYDKSEYGTSHNKVNKSLTDNGVFEYFNGSGELPDNYDIIRYDPTNPNADSEGFVTVNYEDVNTIDKVYDLFGVEYK